MTQNILNFSKIFKVSFFDFNKVRFQAMGLLIASCIFLVFKVIAVYLYSMAYPLWAVDTLNILGSVLTAIVLLLTTTGIARMIKADMLHQSPVTRREAKQFITNKALAIIIAPFLLLLFCATVVYIEYIISLLANVPIAGPLILALLTIPALIINVVLVILFVIGVELIPAVIATEETGIIETVKIVFRVCNEEPLKVAFFTGILFLVGLAIFVVPIGAFIGSLIITANFLHKIVFINMSFQMIPAWTSLLFWVITGGSVLVTGSLIIALPLTYFQGVFTSTYLYLKAKI